VGKNETEGGEKTREGEIAKQRKVDASRQASGIQGGGGEVGKQVTDARGTKRVPV